jgi:superfamily II DNA or RNA helicase
MQEEEQQQQRKRQRPNWKAERTNSSSSSDNRSLLTPHTLRLLKVLKDGTCAHAQVAACHIRDICRQSSPEVLWDILGRLEGYLVSGEFTSRQNAATAMEGVAACLPSTDQTDFLESAIDGETGLWLNVRDLANRRADAGESGMQSILRKGRLMLVSSGNEFDMTDTDDLFGREQSQLEAMDRYRGQQDFVEQRVRLQRHILAQRLGLAGVMNVMGTSVLPAEITAEDLVGSSNVETKPKKQPKSEDDSDSNSIRALLVLEMEDQRKTQRGSASHKKPQTLLATELLYRMFDADWTKRQGAIMGILALLKAWQGSAGIFGSWPKDILTRCLCVLALDRFGDYGEGMVAPVRQVAGQLLAVLYQRAPVDVQEDCQTLLIELATYEDEWEVRHGGLVGLTFIVALSDEGGVESEEIVMVAIRCLSDDNDDVKGAAATILLSFVDSNKTFPWTRPCAKPLWRAISTVRSVSTCADDLISLFSAILCRETQLVLDQIEEGLDQVLKKLTEVLGYESLSVKLSTFKAIGSLTNSILSLSSGEHIRALTGTHYALVSYLFETHWNLNSWTDDTLKREALTKERDDVWFQTVEQASFLFQYAMPNKAPRNSVILHLTLRYFGIMYESTSWTAPKRLDASPLSVQRHAAYALAHFWVVMMKTFDIDQFVRTTLYALIHSPWTFLCESACLLHEALCRNVGLLPWMETCHTRLIEILNEKPVCIRYHEQSSIKLERNIHGFDHDLVQHLQNALQSGELVSSDCLISSWTDDLSKVETLDLPVSIVHMRVSTTVASAIVAGGRCSLPAKLTPLLRTLMTSFKSEADDERRELTCEAVFCMLQSLTDDRHRQVKAKVLSNICKMLVESPLSFSGIAAARVIEKLASTIPRGQTIESLSPLWSQVVPLTTGCPTSLHEQVLEKSLNVLKVLSGSLLVGSRASLHLIESTMGSLVGISCTYKSSEQRVSAASTIKSLCKLAAESVLLQSVPCLLTHLKDAQNVAFRVGACKLLHLIIEEVDMKICPFVRILLPIAMSLMADPEEACAKQASQTFAILVRVAPLVRESFESTWQTWGIDDHSESVMDHLIHGKPLPPCELPSLLAAEMVTTGISLRSYQQEGISWLRFLQTTKLNGALCDDMGVGKTIQALVAMALSHDDAKGAAVCSLVVCPSTLVGLWLNEIKKFFPSDSIFRPFALVGNSKHRASLWTERPSDCNLVVTSYSVLRSDIKLLGTTRWQCCILDEGHLLKNPKTATAIAARRLQSKHKLILTGTPVQNHVNELWATFDFLLPNFLGSQAAFSKAFARPIANSQQPGASAEAISTGMEKLKVLHQQVLPFILRREKAQVLKELPPKIVTDIPCTMSEEQNRLYKHVCESASARKSLSAFQQAVERSSLDSTPNSVELGSDVLKTLLCLRLLCTHPALVLDRIEGLDIHSSRANDHLEASGKLLALNELLRTAGIGGSELTAADNDTSLIYAGSTTSKDSVASVLDGDNDEDDFSSIRDRSSPHGPMEKRKCLIFAQFTQSLDVVEKFLFQPHMPSLRYLRLDGSVPPENRSDIVDLFNNDDSIQVLLLTTRVGGLGLNLTSASMVVFLEHDYNPHADLQAADRCYRLGQSKTVNVYRLITTDTIEEQIRALQKVKLAMSAAIVNTENSSMYSMGTDRLLDIFTFRSEQDDDGRDAKTEGSKHGGIGVDAVDDAYYDADEYNSLTVQEFVKEFSIKRMS